MNSGVDADSDRPSALDLASKNTTEIGSKQDYITQPQTNLGVAKNKEVVLKPNYQYKRRFQ